MEDTWLQKWNNRYRENNYVFGKEPNAYLKEKIEKLKPQKILFAAEGDARNAIFACKKGWEVSAFDISKEAQKKALGNACRNGVTIKYQIGELPNLKYTEEEFDAIALIYAHFPAALKSNYHKQLSKLLRKGGVIILEAFSKKHINYRKNNPKIGGPQDLESLFSVEEIKSDFRNYKIIELEEKEIQLEEGEAHKGKGSVIRFMGRKK